jgi:transposase
LGDLDVDQEIIGFLDESSPQTTSSTARMWSFLRPTKYKKTDSYEANCFGFYSINGNSTVDFMQQSRKEDVCLFLDRTRIVNPNRRITVILDNFASHRSLAVRKKADEPNIRLVFLPQYSPDLNPIEFLWKSVKGVVSTTLVMSEWHLKRIIEKTFLDISAFNSYAIVWIRRFIPEEYNRYRRLGI